MENVLWATAYLAVGLATLAAPLWHRPRVRTVVFWVLAIAGVFILLRSAFGGGYAQIGMLVNFERGTDYQF